MAAMERCGIRLTMLRFSLDQPEAAARIETAVDAVLTQGLRTPDIYSDGTTKVGTVAIGDAVVKAPN